MPSPNPLSGARPWGVTRAVPVDPSIQADYTDVRLDPVTQVVIYRDATGRPVEATGHKHEGTTRTVSRSQPTSGGGDGKNPPPSDDAQITTYVPD